jgi:formylglycine-generating enzyme required for sulfatase activity
MKATFLFTVLLISLIFPAQAQSNVSDSTIKSVEYLPIQVIWVGKSDASIRIGDMEFRMQPEQKRFFTLKANQPYKVLILENGTWTRSLKPLLPDFQSNVYSMQVLNGQVNILAETEEQYYFRTKKYTGIQMLDANVLRQQLADQMVMVQGGSFSMGCTNPDKNACYEDELPLRTVTVNNYYISKYEVTVQQWMSVMGPGSYPNPDCAQCPVEQVSWNAAMKFLEQLNALTGEVYRLPTEAEWEYAARGGRKSKGYEYSGGNEIDNFAWYESNSVGVTHQVGTLQPNELGLYDMSGNVWEWCADQFYETYKGLPVNNPLMVGSGEYKVVRGGSWYNKDRNCTVYYRGRYQINGGGGNCGLRLAKSAK